MLAVRLEEVMHSILAQGIEVITGIVWIQSRADRGHAGVADRCGRQSLVFIKVIAYVFALSVSSYLEV